MDADEGDEPMNAHERGDIDPDLLGPEARRELLNAYLDGELSAEGALGVSAWLDANPGALREVEHLRHLWDLLEHYEDEPVSEDFAPRVMRAVGMNRKRLRRDARPAPGRLLPLAWYRRPLAAVAAVLVAVGATVVLMPRREPDPRGPLAPATDVAAVLEDVPSEQLGELLLNADALLSLDADALDEDYDDESYLGG
jgi:anti-sigma factor RsiW